MAFSSRCPCTAIRVRRGKSRFITVRYVDLPLCGPKSQFITFFKLWRVRFHTKFICFKMTPGALGWIVISNSWLSFVTNWRAVNAFAMAHSIGAVAHAAPRSSWRGLRSGSYLPKRSSFLTDSPCAGHTPCQYASLTLLRSPWLSMRGPSTAASGRGDARTSPDLSPRFRELSPSLLATISAL